MDGVVFKCGFMGFVSIMRAVRASGFDADQVSQHIGFFLGAAFAAKHVFAVAFEPFVGFGGVGESFGIEGRGQGLDAFAGTGVFALCRGRCAVARRARPFAAVALLEQGLTPLGLGRGVRLRRPVAQLLAIVRELVDLYGGALQLQTPAQGRGLQVTLTLPSATVTQTGD